MKIELVPPPCAACSAPLRSSYLTFPPASSSFFIASRLPSTALFTGLERRRRGPSLFETEVGPPRTPDDADLVVPASLR